MNMNIVWFWSLAGMLAAYAVLDGYDLGVGALHVWVAHTDPERRLSLSSIGPVWNGNEVWLIAAGGMMVVSFPRVYASGFSGFYLALMVVLWLLILRGVSLEFRGQFPYPLWRAFWDAVFTWSSLLLALLLGVALGNVVRGLPIAADGTFQGSFTVLLNPFSVLTGLLSVAVLSWHGTHYLRLKTEGALHERAARWSRPIGILTVLLAVSTTLSAFDLRQSTFSPFLAHPVSLLFPVLVVIAFALALRSDRRADGEALAFRASAGVIPGMLICAGISVFPNLLISTVNPAFSLNIYNAASTTHALRTAFAANIVGMIGVAVYTTYVHRTFRGKVRLEDAHY